MAGRCWTTVIVVVPDFNSFAADRRPSARGNRRSPRRRVGGAIVRFKAAVGDQIGPNWVGKRQIARCVICTLNGDCNLRGG